MLREDDVHHAKQTDLDKLGIAKTAREEKKRARDEKLKQQENERMAKLYRQHVLKGAARRRSWCNWRHYASTGETKTRRDRRSSGRFIRGLTKRQPEGRRKAVR